MGKSFEKEAVIHAVLCVEQLLTTGGGWQDQMSGIMGGVNRGHSSPCLPLTVQVERLTLSDRMIDALNSHLLLIYTGKVRLAKNLLQNVIRSWYAKEETIVKCFKDLITFSLQIKDAIMKGDFPEMGRLMDAYWEQKKTLAPGCEPSNVREILNLTRPLAYGQLLVGAGGGGFMCILTKEPNSLEKVKSALDGFKDKHRLTFHQATVDSTGLEIEIESTSN